MKQTNEPVAWNKLTGIGQLKAGMNIRFSMNGVDIETDVKEVLFAGTKNEEIVYNRKKNHYFIVGLVLDNKSHAKQVEYQASNTITIPVAEYAKLKEDAERLRFLIDNNLTLGTVEEERVGYRSTMPNVVRERWFEVTGWIVNGKEGATQREAIDAAIKELK